MRVAMSCDASGDVLWCEWRCLVLLRHQSRNLVWRALVWCTLVSCVTPSFGTGWRPYFTRSDTRTHPHSPALTLTHMITNLNTHTHTPTHELTPSLLTLHAVQVWASTLLGTDTGSRRRPDLAQNAACCFPWFLLALAVLCLCCVCVVAAAAAVCIGWWSESTCMRHVT